MKAKKDLEEKIKEKIFPLLEETMEKSLGVAIPKVEEDITDRLLNPQLNVYIPFNLDFHDAKREFKKEFMKRELRLHLGNVSQLAKNLGLDRRSVHRVIKDFDIDIEELRKRGASVEEQYEKIVDKTIRSALEQYKEIIQPRKMEQLYQEVPTLSRNIVKVLPHQELSWKEAEEEFERQFLKHALQDGKTVVALAKTLGVRQETLYRKLKKLGLR